MPGKYKQTMYACYLGHITQAINNNLAPLFFVIFHEQFGLSFEMLGRLVLLNFGTQIFADILSVKYVDRVGYRKAAVLAHALCFIGLLGLGILPLIMANTFLALSIAVFISAFGGGITEVILSPVVESLPTTAKAASMSLLHAFYCWGQMAVVILTTLAVWIFGSSIWFYIPVFWALVPFYTMLKFTRVPLLTLVPEGEEMPISQLFRAPLFLIGLLLMLSAGASELTMSQWSSLFAEMGLGVPKLVGDLVGPALFAFLMGMGRTIYGVMGEKVNLQTALKYSSMLCTPACVVVFCRFQILLLACASVSLLCLGLGSLTRFPEAVPPCRISYFGDWAPLSAMVTGSFRFQPALCTSYFGRGYGLGLDRSPAGIHGYFFPA